MWFLFGASELVVSHVAFGAFSKASEFLKKKVYETTGTPFSLAWQKNGRFNRLFCFDLQGRLQRKTPRKSWIQVPQ